MDSHLELTATKVDERIELRAPAAGFFTCSLESGVAVTAGQACGVLLRLGHATRLVIPHGASGLVVSERPARVHAPVGFGSVLYELRPLEAVSEDADDAASTDKQVALSIPSPQSGRFYHRPAPNDPAFVAAGDVLETGRPIGLIEVMKTFTQLPYRADKGLPLRARVVRYLVEDGADVNAGDALIEIEPA